MCTPARLKEALVAPWLIALLCMSACVPHPQRYLDFSTHTPLESGQFLVLGFAGGREAWDNPGQGVRRLALHLRTLNLPASIETVENQKRDLALRLIEEAFDKNGSRRLEDAEKDSVRLILYGQSFGGAAVVKLANQLSKRGIPVRLTVQIDSVGRGDGVIPSNVLRAANLYQANGMLIRGQHPVRARDASRTQILGNYRFDYTKKDIDLAGVPWHEKLFRVAHTRMGLDPEVWELVKRLILEELER